MASKSKKKCQNWKKLRTALTTRPLSDPYDRLTGAVAHFRTFEARPPALARDYNVFILPSGFRTFTKVYGPKCPMSPDSCLPLGAPLKIGALGCSLDSLMLYPALHILEYLFRCSGTGYHCQEVGRRQEVGDYSPSQASSKASTHM